MITVEQLRALKKGNASVDAEKSKTRIPEAFKNATREQKAALSEMTGFASSSFYNVSRTGTASPRMVLAMSQILDVSPFYLTGETDEKKSCDAVELAVFFNKCNSAKPAKVKEKPVKVKAEKTVKAEKPVNVKSVKVKAEKLVKIKAEKPVKVKAEKIAPAPAPEKKRVAAKAAVNDLETLELLLRALSLRAKFYGGEAEAAYREVAALLTK